MVAVQSCGVPVIGVNSGADAVAEILAEAVRGEVDGVVTRWRDHAEAGERAHVAARFDDGAALLEQGRFAYLCGWPDPQLLRETLSRLAGRAGLRTIDLPSGVRLRRRGPLTFAFNYDEPEWALPADAVPQLGPRILKPGELAIW